MIRSVLKILRGKVPVTISLLLYCTVIITVSHLPLNDSGSGLMILNDKVMHTLEYFILGILSFRYFYIARNKKTIPSYFLTFAFGTLFALSDEIHQGFVGYLDSGLFGSVRNPDIFDFMADVSGIALSVVIFYLYRNFNKEYKLETDAK